MSECNDLALIDINADEPLPYLEWHDGDITAGLDVYAAGYPLGDPEFTLTRGIIAKAEAGGDLTGTCSIDHTVEHDANIQPGNSGGPLVGADGKVVAVNYAGGASVTTTAQFYGIASDLAQPVIDQLRDGDFESLGINGWAVYDETLGIAGIWVAGVAPGSPAAEAELMPGDIVTSMNGLPVGTDGTFKDYCDVIRTAGEGAPIAVEVLRFDTSEVLKGEINGDQPIELAFSFAEEVGDEVGEDSDAAAAAYTYESVTDDLGRIYVDVPDGLGAARHRAGVDRRGRGAVHRGVDRPRRLPQRLHGARPAVRPAPGDVGHRRLAGPVRLRRRLHRRRDHRLLRPGVHRQVPALAGLRRHHDRRRDAGGPARRRLATRPSSRPRSSPTPTCSPSTRRSTRSTPSPDASGRREALVRSRASR